MAEQPKSGVGRKSLSARKKMVNPFPANIGEYHETHPLGGGVVAPEAASASVAPAVPAMAPVVDAPTQESAPAPPMVVQAPAEEIAAPTTNGQHPAPAVAAVQPAVAPAAPVFEQPPQEVAAAPVAAAPVQEVTPAPVQQTAAPVVAPAAVEQPAELLAQPAPVQEAPPVQPTVAPVQAPAPAPVQDSTPAPAPTEAPAQPEQEQVAAPARRSDAPRLSEMKPVPVEPLGEGLFDAYVTGSFIDYPVGARYEDYIDLDFSQGYNKAFRRMEARVSPLIEDWLEKIARKINDQSRVAGSSKHLNDTRMRNNAVLRTALEKGLRDLIIDGATSEASLRALNGLPPAPEQGLFNTFLRDKLRRQQEEFDD